MFDLVKKVFLAIHGYIRMEKVYEKIKQLLFFTTQEGPNYEVKSKPVDSDQITLPKSTVVLPPRRKRGRPRKENQRVVTEERYNSERLRWSCRSSSVRPRRSCRGPSVRMTPGLALNPIMKSIEEATISTKSKQIIGLKPKTSCNESRSDDSEEFFGLQSSTKPIMKSPDATHKRVISKHLLENSEPEVYQQQHSKKLKFERLNELKTDLVDVIESKLRDECEMVIRKEKARKSDSSSTTRTPSEQVISTSSVDVEESHKSCQSSATMESGIVRRGFKLEAPQDVIISAEQLAEYTWGGGGPYMLQEQVAQFLGINKSFKRKCPGIKQRPVVMQEKDFIKRNRLASEAMCNSGLTAVNRSDVLNLMFLNYPKKYKEYCQYQRCKQAENFKSVQKPLNTV